MLNPATFSDALTHATNVEKASERGPQPVIHALQRRYPREEPTQGAIADISRGLAELQYLARDARVTRNEAGRVANEQRTRTQQRNRNVARGQQPP